jgi:signal transduction histidine kinase
MKTGSSAAARPAGEPLRSPSSSAARPAGEPTRKRSVIESWWLNLPLRDKGLLVVVMLPLTTLVAAVLMRIPYSQQQEQTAALTNRVAEMRDVSHELQIALLDLESGIRGYALTGDESFLSRVTTARQSVPVHLNRLMSLRFRPEDQPVIDEVSQLCARALAAADRVARRGHAGGSGEDVGLRRELASEQGFLDAARAALLTLRRNQDVLVSESESELERRRQRLRPIILVTLFGGLAAALAAGWLFATGIAGRINALERNAERLAAGERLHYEPSRGLDEIGSLDLTLRRASLRLRTRERELRDLNARLEHTLHEQRLLNRELEAFSYSVSHDLRAPLRSIDGFAQALREDWGERLDEVAQDYLARVRNAAQRMGQLIDDLLKLSKLTRSQIQRTDVDLSEIARQVSAELNDRQPGRHVTWVIADGLRAWCDTALTRILLENLLGNAWKFTAKTEQPRIEFDIMRDTNPPVFVIRDNGAGFDMRYVDKLFAPFQRLHGEREFPGTGIGLATVQRIVHKHGGQVRTRSEVGAGATFYFTLEASEGVEAVA